MAINKFIDREGNTLLDLSADSVTSENFVLAGKTYHGPDGLQHTGTLDPGPLDYSQYNFIDYDGTLLYSYTDEELDALSELPAGPDHTNDNLTFQGWNWSLADLKAWDKTRPDRPLVGANLITTDGKSYLYLDTPYAGVTLNISISKSATSNLIDWGDGTVDTNKSHVYANPGQYVIVIDSSNGYWYFTNSSQQPTTSDNRQWIKKIKLGNVTMISSNAYEYLYNLESISIPNGITKIGDKAFYRCYTLKNISIPNSITSIAYQLFNMCNCFQNISIPNSITSIGEYAFADCSSISNISIPSSVTSISNYAFENCRYLKKITIPNSITSDLQYLFNNCYSLQNVLIQDGLTSIGQYLFYSCNSLKSVSIPNSITSIGKGAFNGSYCLILDLSKQTKIITLTSDIGVNTSWNRILVPKNLLSDYQSASYWSSYAACMVGV